MRPLGPALCLLVAALACTPTTPTASTGSRVRDPAPTPKSAQEAIDEAVAVAPLSTITIIAEAPGRDPAEIESQVTMPVEAALRSIPGLARIESRSSAGSATLTLTLEPGAELQRTRAAVLGRMENARSTLPDDVSTHLAADVAGPSRSAIFSLGPSGDGRAGPDVLATVVDELRRELLRTPGVAAVDLCGERPPQLLIAADPERLKAFAITPLALRQALQAAAVSGPSPGLVRPVDSGSSAGIEELESLVVTTAGAPPSPIYLRDLASLSIEPAQPDCDAIQVGVGEVIIGVVRPRRGADGATTRAAVEATVRGQIERLGQRGALLQIHPPPIVTIHLEVPATPLGDPSRSLRDALRDALPGALPGAHQALLLAPRDDGPVDAELLLLGAPIDRAELRQLQGQLEGQLARIPGLHVRDIQPLGVASRQRLRIIGDDLDVAYGLAHEVARLAETVPGVLRARPHTAMTPEISVHERRDAIARLGLTLDQVTQTTALALHDVEIGRRLIDGRDLRVLLRIGDPQALRRRPDAIGSIDLPLADGGTVRLDAIADIRLSTAPRRIDRVDHRRSVDIDLRLAEPDLRPAVQRLLADKLDLPPGVVLVWE